MLIRNAEVSGRGLLDVELQGGRIAAISPASPGSPSEDTVFDARGGALLPGLNDHHLHLAGLAVSKASVRCGPPDVTDAASLAAQLQRPGDGWLRGIGYHESVMGLPDAAALDQLVPDRPVRIQHRGGRMWLLNSRALDELLAGATPPPGLERSGGRYTGRLFDEDAWLRAALGSQPPDFADVSRELAALGVTSFTDMTPQNDAAAARHFGHQRCTGALLQRAVLAGTLDLARAPGDDWTLGPAKLHLHEAALPDFDETLGFIRAAHAQDRGVAVHCTTEVEIVFTLALLEEAGPHPRDRIEHASITDPGHVARIAAMGLSVCVQPHFIAERGDAYLADVEPHHHANLYRLASLQAAGIPLAGGSDAPFGGLNPWLAMAAATDRRTSSGEVIGPDEALSPDAALALWLADPLDLSRTRCVAVGEPADLVLLDAPWAEAGAALASTRPLATWINGSLVYQRVNQPPGERGAGGNSPA